LGAVASPAAKAREALDCHDKTMRADEARDLFEELDRTEEEEEEEPRLGELDGCEQFEFFEDDDLSSAAALHSNLQQRMRQLEQQQQQQQLMQTSGNQRNLGSEKIGNLVIFYLIMSRKNYINSN
jgi:hypothetical protein